MVSSSIRDSAGTLESWATDGSFLSLPFGLCLALEAGRPVGQAAVAAFCDGAIARCYHSPSPPPVLHFRLFHLLKHYTSSKVQDEGCRPPEALPDVCSAFPWTPALASAVAH